MLALFVFDSKAKIQTPYENRGHPVAEWELLVEFVQVSTRLSVDYATAEIDWSRPRFRLEGAAAQVVPGYALRPGATDLLPYDWYDLSIRYA